MKKILSIIIAACCLFSSLFVTSFATNEDPFTTAKFEEALNDYFEVREADFTNSSRTANNTSVVMSENVKADNAARKEQIVLKMQNVDNIFAVEVQTTPRVLEKNVKANGNIEATVYEWTWIEYNSTGKGPATDELGYATMHDMLFVPTENGYKVERDTYFEGNTTGAVSSDYIIEETAFIEDDNSDIITATATPYRPAEAARYADAFVENTPNTVIGQNTDYYNLSIYGYIPNNDCANYVSQCLLAGGLEETDDWYFDSPIGNNSVENCCPVAWRSVTYLTSYLTSQGYSKVVASNSNVKMGNPVYVTGHIVICVGENSSGTPIINGHTNDMYHCPWTWVRATGSTATIRTILITQ
ncbi:MAG: amidase domain-containing protein [Oscillospiraceae bacterium]